jgi:hypothetical protein
MKKFFTLFCLVAAVLGVQAQTVNTLDKSYILQHKAASQKNVSVPAKIKNGSEQRSSTYAVSLDNVSADSYYSDVLSSDFFFDPTLEINKNYPNSANLTHRFGVALFDSLIYIDANNQDVPAFLPRNKTQFVLDSIDMFFTHTHTTANNDTIRITIFDRDSLGLTGTGAAQNIVVNKKWDTVIVTNTVIPSNITIGQTPAIGLTFYPNLSFLKGKSFGVRVDFAGDTANKFTWLASFRDDCLNACVAAESAVNSATYTNSLWYVNAIAGTTNISGINSIQFNCDPTCNLWTAQNWWAFPWITATVDYSAAIVADSLTGCPGTSLNMKAFAFGSDAAPFTYSWATTSGQLSSTSSEDVTLIVGSSNAVVTVTVTDANSQTTTASVSVASRGINISITQPSPIQLACGSNTTITTSISGVTQGRVYTWSTGATGANASSISVSQAGIYRVTVTNNAGCSATASVTVQYPNGVTNNVNFNLPADVKPGVSFPGVQVCANALQTFSNTSSSTAGWNSEWTFGDSNIGFSTNGTNTYASPGVYSVVLKMDSAGCLFSSAPKSINVIAATDAACTGPIGFGDNSFDQSISMMPNPSNGNVSLTVNEVEKNISIRVYNIIGSEVKSFNTNDVTSTFNRTFDFSDLANGTYLVKIQSGAKTAVKRLTISK